MKLIAHRGNTDGADPSKENNPEYIEQAIAQGFDVEIDLRHKDYNFYLGHDEPQYHVPMSWLVKWKDKLWIHCKDLESLDKISSSEIDFHYFWHQEDDFTLTSTNKIWTYPGKPYTPRSVIVMPEWDKNINQFVDLRAYNCYGICSDYINILSN